MPHVPLQRTPAWQAYQSHTYFLKVTSTESAKAAGGGVVEMVQSERSHTPFI